MFLQIFKGKERDAMLSMLPYLRLAHISNPEDMQAVGSAEGAICATAVSLTSRSLEHTCVFFME